VRFLLDTNIVSDLVRNPMGRSEQRLAAVGESNVCTSVIVAAELRFGIERKKSIRLERQVELILQRLEVVSLDVPADKVYAKVRARLELGGRLISANDMLIAAHALALGMTLVTDNDREFARVEGLAVENWVR